MKIFCLIVITVQNDSNKESWYVLKMMGLYFSGMTNKNKLSLSLSLSFHVSILNKMLLTTR